MNEDYSKRFSGVVGQKRLLKHLSLLIDIQNNSGYLKPILIVGQRGGGKNTLGTALCRNLVNPADQSRPKTTFEVNCSSISSLSDFFDDIIVPRLINTDVNILLDEFHNIVDAKKVVDCLLSIWNTQNYVNDFTFNNQLYQFDARRISWVCLTSEIQILPETLRSRMEVLQLEDLNLMELAQIVGKRLKKVKLETPELLIDIASYGRNNGRHCDGLGEVISQYLHLKNKTHFCIEDWTYLKGMLGLRPDGINNLEFRIMKYLRQNGHASLTKLSSALQLSNESARLGYEKYLLARGYMNILPQRGRELTTKGIRYLTEVEE
jgi:Holliday junction resolvasome RuvABC ATP-dependent DNA helicase subunit